MKILFLIALAISAAESCRPSNRYKCDSKFTRTTGSVLAESIVYDTNDTSGAVFCALKVQANDSQYLQHLAVGYNRSLLCDNFGRVYCPLCQNQTEKLPDQGMNFTVTCQGKNAAPETTEENLNRVTTAGIETPKRATSADKDGPINVSLWTQTSSTTTILDAEGSLGATVGIIIGVVIVVLLIAIVTGILLRRHRAARKETERKSGNKGGKSTENATYVNSPAHPSTSSSNAQQDAMYHTIPGELREGDSGYEYVRSGHPQRNAPTASNSHETGESGYAACGPKYMNMVNPSRTLYENRGHQEEPAYLVPLPIPRPQYMDLT